MSIPLHELNSAKALRLAYCYHCHTLTTIELWGERRGHDVFLQRWVDEHMHGMTVEQHPGGRVFVKEASQFDHSGRAGEMFEEQAIEEVRAELAKANQDVIDLRESLREDAVKCHRRHGQPSLPGKLCSDYRADSKRVGVQQGSVTKGVFQHLCDYCPYESTVKAIRA